ACLSRSRCPCCSSMVPTTAAFSPSRSTTDIGSPPRTRWRSSPTSVTSCTSRPPRGSRNGSRHGPSRGSIVQAEVDQPLALYGNGTAGFELAEMLKGWSNDLVLCTDGVATLSEDESRLLSKNNISIREERMFALRKKTGSLRILFLRMVKLLPAKLFSFVRNNSNTQS